MSRRLLEVMLILSAVAACFDEATAGGGGHGIIGFAAQPASPREAVPARPSDKVDAALQKDGSARWEKSIAAFEAEDRQSAPPPNGIVFVGSSSIRMWKLERSFPDLPAVNRGFGGSQIIDSVHFADRIILPYTPRAIVLYAGDNDIAKGKSAEQVFADYQAFEKKIREGLPWTRVFYICIKPSLKRWELWPEMNKANTLIRDYAERNGRTVYVDVATPMLAEDGRPRKELFAKDGLHLNEAGYAVWAEALRPLLGRKP